MISLNIQSIFAKYNELEIFMNVISKVTNVQIICLQETYPTTVNIAPYLLIKKKYSLDFIIYSWGQYRYS